MAGKNTESTPAGGSMSGSSGTPGRDGSTPAKDNPDRPAIGVLGGYTPDTPEELDGGGSISVTSESDHAIDERTFQENDLDETDKEYLKEFLEGNAP